MRTYAYIALVYVLQLLKYVTHLGGSLFDTSCTSSTIECTSSYAHVNSLP
jgi:hypothetical protein